MGLFGIGVIGKATICAAGVRGTAVGTVGRVREAVGVDGARDMCCIGGGGGAGGAGGTIGGADDGAGGARFCPDGTLEVLMRAISLPSSPTRPCSSISSSRMSDNSDCRISPSSTES